MMYGDGYDREDRGDDAYPSYRPTRFSGVSDGGGRYPGYELSTTGDAPVGPPLSSADGGEKRRGMPLWQELPLLLVVAFCLAVLIRTFLLQAFFIPSGSMEDTLRVGDRVVVNKIIYDMRTPERGEIVVFTGTENWAPENPQDPNAGFFSRLGRTVGDLVGISRPGEKDFIKRVIGLPGDVVACCDVDGKVTVNGHPLDEPYVTDNSPLEAPVSRDCKSRRFDPVTVEPGHMFVLGDNRRNSMDSRCQGVVPLDHVVGRAWVILWPFGHWSKLDAPATFSDVPKPFAAGPLRDAAAVPARPASLAAGGGVEVLVALPLLWSRRLFGTKPHLSATPARSGPWPSRARRRLAR